MDGEILYYTVKARTHVAGQRLRDLALPDGLVVTLILSGRAALMPRGTTQLLPGDQVFVAMRISLEPLINRLFEPDPEPPVLSPDLPLSFQAEIRVEQLHGFWACPCRWVELAGEAAGESLGSQVPGDPSGGEVRLGALRISTGADPEHVSVRYDTEAA